MRLGVMSTLASRKRHALRAKGNALEREFAHWLMQSEAGHPFEKHRSQIRRISARLTGILNSIAAEREMLTDDDVLTRGAQVEQKMLATHLVWEFFRSRIALRADEYLRRYLRACDDFVWACYLPFLERLGVRKEPPLVFLNGGWSPFAVSRDVSFKWDRPGFLVDGPAVSWLETGEFQEAVEKLPVPMIGVPWFQVNHLPDALVLGHEMGHIVEVEFNLTADLERAIARAPTVGRTEAWQAWRREAFADVFGCLAGGPRFGETLFDFLATDRDKVKSEKRAAPDWGLYPSRWMRVALVAESLRHMGFGDDADRLRSSWGAEFGDTLHNEEFEPDIAPIAKAILDGPYPSLEKEGNASLNGVLTFHRDALGRARDMALADAVRGKGLPLANSVRELVAAARVLFSESPQEYEKADYAKKIFTFIDQVAPKGTRGTRAVDLEDVAAQDEKFGASDGL